jgi:hypothetical protein
MFIHQPEQCLPVNYPPRRRFDSLDGNKIEIVSEQNPNFIEGFARTYQPDNLFPPRRRGYHPFEPAFLYDVQTLAGFTFQENNFSLFVLL